MKKIEKSIPFPIERKINGKIVVYGAGIYGEIAEKSHWSKWGIKLACYTDKAL